MDIGQCLLALRRRQLRQVFPHPGAPEIVEPVENLARHHAIDLGDHGAGGFERLGGLHGDLADFLVQRLAGAGIEHQPDAKLARRFFQRLPVDVVGRQAHAVAAIGPRQHAHHQGRIVDGAGQRPGDAADIGRIDRDSTEARLQREQPAPAGRQPHRAADIGAEMQRPITGSACRTGAGTGAAGVLGEVPGIAGEGMEAGEPRRQHAVIRHGGFRENHRTGFAQPGGGWRIAFGRYQRHAGCPQRHRHALGGDIVLDGDRHAVEHADRLAIVPAFGRCPGDRARAVGVEGVQRLDMRLPRRDVRQHVFQHFRRRKLLGAEAREQVDGAEIMQRGDGFV